MYNMCRFSWGFFSRGFLALRGKNLARVSSYIHTQADFSLPFLNGYSYDRLSLLIHG